MQLFLPFYAIMISSTHNSFEESCINVIIRYACFVNFLAFFLGGAKRNFRASQLEEEKEIPFEKQTFEFASREKNTGTIRKIFNSIDARDPKRIPGLIGPRKFRVLAHPLHLLDLMRFRNDYERERAGFPATSILPN